MNLFGLTSKINVVLGEPVFLFSTNKRMFKAAIFIVEDNNIWAINIKSRHNLQAI